MSELPLVQAKGRHRFDGICQEWIKFGNDTSWLICPYDHRIQEEVSSEIFQPYKRSLEGTAIRTFDPQTQLFLQYMMGPLRSKDEVAVAKLNAHIQQQDNLLPTVLFTPFAHFSVAVRERRQSRSLMLAERIGSALLSAVPTAIRHRAGPTTRRAANALVRASGLLMGGRS